MRTLQEIGNTYRTDKAAFHHGFCDFYDMHLSSCRHDEMKVLEIGVKKGASLRMWRDYFSNSQIYGLDIDPASMFEDSRIKTFIMDQGDVDSMKRFVEVHGPFDIVIDDGSHHTHHQFISYELFKDSPVFIWEDLHTSNWDVIGHRVHDTGKNEKGQYPLEVANELVKIHDNHYMISNRGGNSITMLIDNR